MNAVLECIYSRTSVRKYLPDQIPEKDVAEILKAGFRGANGLNAQALRFAVVQNRADVKRYSDLAKELYLRDSEMTGNFHPVLNKIASDKGRDIFHGAPSIITVFASPEAITPVEDGSIAIANMMLAAHSMGYGTCYIGMAAGLGYYSSFREENGVPAECGYVGCIALGKPDGEPEKHPRGEVPILCWRKE